MVEDFDFEENEDNVSEICPNCKQRATLREIKMQACCTQAAADSMLAAYEDRMYGVEEEE